MKRLLSALLCLAILASVMILTAMPSNAADNKRIHVTIRDFKKAGRLFAGSVSTVNGLVRPAIGPNRKPDFSDPLNPDQPFPGWKDWTNSEDIAVYDLNALFNDAPGINMAATRELNLIRGEDGFYQPDKSDPTIFDGDGMFFPIDNQLFGNEGDAHNSYFTAELHARFDYTGSEQFSFESGGDAWIFIDGQLVIISGCGQSSGSGFISLHNLVSERKLVLVPGETYDFDMFYIEHNSSQLAFSFSTNISLFNREYGKASDWAAGYLDKAGEMGIITNRLKGSDMTVGITREEFTEIAVKFYELLTGKEAQPANTSFLDCSNPEVLKAYALKITAGLGVEKKFAPNSPVTRQQMATMIVNTLRACYPTILIDTFGQGAFKDQKQFASYAVESAKFFVKYNISAGDGKGSFLPTAKCTRQDAIMYFVRAYDIKDTYIIFREVETTVKNGVKIDKTDYPFEPDDSVLGEWITVDYIKDPKLFDPNKKQWQNPYYYSIIFSFDRTCNFTTYYDPERVPLDTLRNLPSDSWTKGLVISDGIDCHLSSRYYVTKINNKEYLFLEYKNGDYAFRNATPYYYIFTRE